jgi:hypothetical protein
VTESADTFVVDPVAPPRFSMSFKRAAQGCLRRAHLERQADTAGADALVGRVFHEIAATVGLGCVFRGEVTIDRDDALVIAERVMAEPEEIGPLPIEAFEQVLDLVRWWAPAVEFKPGERFEIDSRQPLAGKILSSRIDRLWIDGPTAEIQDYKTGWGDPVTQLPFQGKAYAWHVLTAHPDVDRVLYREDYVRHGICSDWWEVTRDDLPRIETYLRTLVARIDQAYAAGTLPATPGAGCSTPSVCPVAETCPVPTWARPVTLIDTRDDAIAEFEQVLQAEAALDSRRRKIRGYLEKSGDRAVEVNGVEYGYSTKNGSSFNKKALQADLAIQRGEPVDLADYTTQTAKPCGRRNVA